MLPRRAPLPVHCASVGISTSLSCCAAVLTGSRPAEEMHHQKKWLEELKIAKELACVFSLFLSQITKLQETVLFRLSLWGKMRKNKHQSGTLWYYFNLLTPVRGSLGCKRSFPGKHTSVRLFVMAQLYVCYRSFSCRFYKLNIYFIKKGGGVVCYFCVHLRTSKKEAGIRQGYCFPSLNCAASKMSSSWMLIE